MKTAPERIDTGERAAAALREFLDPAFANLRAEYVEQLANYAASPVSDHLHGNIVKVALAVKVLDQVAAQVRLLVQDGKAAKDDQDRIRKIERIPPEKRKILGI